MGNFHNTKKGNFNSINNSNSHSIHHTATQYRNMAFALTELLMNNPQGISG